MPARFPEVEVHGPVGGRGTVESLEVGGAPRSWGSSDDDVVITGLSGRFPESNNVEEFTEQLFAGVDLITDDERRWPSGKAAKLVTIGGKFL
jgi:fatty acid synthase